MPEQQYHGLSIEALSDADLREIIDLPEAQSGLRHHIPKPQKVEWLQGATKARKAEILAEAEARRAAHHRALSKRRREGPLDKAAAIEAKLGEHEWSYQGHHRPNGGFRDAATGRKATIAYVLVETRTGERIEVTKATMLDAYDRLGIVRGWPDLGGRPASREAAAAGLVTAANVV